MADQEIQNGAEVTNGAATPAVLFTALKTQLVVPPPKAAEAVQFYKAAFGAEEVGRTMHPKRKADQEIPLVLSAELKIASSVFSVSDFADDSAQVKAEGAGLVLLLETDDVEAAIAKAEKAGASREGDVTEEEGAGRVGKVKDPYGYVWAISSPAAVKNTKADAAPADVEA